MITGPFQVYISHITFNLKKLQYTYFFEQKSFLKCFIRYLCSFFLQQCHLKKKNHTDSLAKFHPSDSKLQHFFFLTYSSKIKQIHFNFQHTELFKQDTEIHSGIHFQLLSVEYSCKPSVIQLRLKYYIK